MKVPEKFMSAVVAAMLAIAVGGCGLGTLINQEADEKINRDETLKPSKHGMLKRIKEVPLQSDLMPTRRELQNEIIQEPDYQDNMIVDDNLPKGAEPQVRIDANKATAFETIFPNENGAERVRVDLDADNLGIANIISRFAADLKFNYTIQSGVNGTVTMSLHTEMSRSELWELFNQLLWMSGAYCDFYDNILYIRPLDQVAKDRRVLEENSSVMMREVRMKYVDANRIFEQISPFLSSASTAKVLPQSNSIMLIDTPENISRTLEIIDELDRNYKQGWYRVVIQCNHVPSKKVKEELKQILPVLGFTVVEGSAVDGTPGAIHLVSLDRLQVLVASASAVEPLVELRNWVNVLNRTDSEEKANAYIYQVVNGDAAQLLRELSVLFPKMQGLIIPAKTGTIQTVNGVAVNAEEMGRAPNTVFEYPLRVSANMEYNRLVIMTTSRVYGILRALLEKLDSVPPQVLLQVMVVEIELTNENSFGLEWGAQATISGKKMNFGTDYSNLNAGEPDQYGGRIHIFDPDSPNDRFLYVKALAGKSRLNVISSPQIMVRSKYTAQVNVGRQVPTLYADITNTNSSTAVSTSVSRSYKYIKTGIILKVTPTISASGLVSLDISQTISEAQRNTTSGLDTPVIKEDVLETDLLLRSGQTIVMGGMIRDRDEESLASIPILAEIPMLNWLGGDSTRANERTEILVLISVMIVDDTVPLEDMVRRYSDSLREINVFESAVYAPYQDAVDRGMPEPEVVRGTDEDGEFLRSEVMRMRELEEGGYGHSGELMSDDAVFEYREPEPTPAVVDDAPADVDAAPAAAPEPLDTAFEAM